ncbi:hypothetical protein Xbud_03738 [Xenorhabdus budapestensis]|uniref:Uncharacterized protein n=1 Tax=Xenorhabdus budapestensis TaxID=290110 RepID=A0A2D0ILE4_XENBU|nr:hypothetical protein Xbud_03738 [Xenorhabdus budapestensis]
MPALYAKIFLSESANAANLRRMTLDYKNINQDLSLLYNEWGSYD